MKYAITQMMKQEPRPNGVRGWIVNISSIGGVVGLSMERMLAIVNSLLASESTNISHSIVLRQQRSSDKPYPTSST